MFSGEGRGGLVIRGDPNSRQPWASSYELDIDWHSDRKHGHIHFPVKPKPYGGNVLIEVGEWHTVKIEARGDHVAVFLNGEQALEFTDNEFPHGSICVAGEKGGVKYRNLTIAPMRIRR